MPLQLFIFQSQRSYYAIQHWEWVLHLFCLFYVLFMLKFCCSFDVEAYTPNLVDFPLLSFTDYIMLMLLYYDESCVTLIMEFYLNYFINYRIGDYDVTRIIINKRQTKHSISIILFHFNAPLIRHHLLSNQNSCQSMHLIQISFLFFLVSSLDFISQLFLFIILMSSSIFIS